MYYVSLIIALSKNNRKYTFLYEWFKEYIAYLVVSVSVCEREKERVGAVLPKTE